MPQNHMDAVAAYQADLEAAVAEGSELPLAPRLDQLGAYLVGRHRVFRFRSMRSAW